MSKHTPMKPAVFLFVLLAVAALPVMAQPGPAGPTVKCQAVTETDAAHPGDMLRVAVTFTMDAGWHMNANKPLDEFSIPTELKLDETPGFAVKQTIYPPHKVKKLAFSPDPLAVYEAHFSVGLVLELAPSLEAKTYTLKGQLHYQACNDKSCAPPNDLPVEIAVNVVAAGQPVKKQAEDVFKGIVWTAGSTDKKDEGKPKTSQSGTVGDWETLAANFKESGRLAGYASKADFLAFLDRAEKGATDMNALAGKRWWLVAALVLGGGLMLNLTPCVLPLIPINIAIIGAGARAGSRKRGFALGAAYGAGISLVYGLLGILVVLGLSSAFGAINSTFWFNGLIAALFVALGLAMFEVINIDLSRFQAKIGVRKNENGSLAVALFMGAVSALLAGACVAPVVIYTLVYAQDQYARGVVIALALPFLLGAGMALPWPFAGAGLSFLPKPGAWMVRVKQVFGVFILVFALYYGHLAYGLFSDRYFVNRGAVEASAEVQEEAGWVSTIEQGLQQAKDEKKPVLLDFWATWCKNCLVMNQTTLKDPEVLKRLDGYVKIKYQAEDPNQSPVKEVWERYSLLGLPTYLVLRPEK